MILLFAFLVMQEASPPRSESEWFPLGIDAYRHPLADPRAPVTGVRLQFPIEKEDHFKIENRLATHVAIWRKSNEGGSVEVQAEGGAFGRFDFDENWDMDGVDFRFGFPIAVRSGPFSVKLHPWHMTSHLGDEYIERTGAERVVYARNEIALGLSWNFDVETRVYFEIGYAFARGDVNEPLRLMAGAETVGRPLGPGTVECFAALNLTSFEEQDYGIQFNLEAGVWLRPEGTSRGVRFSVGYSRGPSVLTQFFEENEEYWTLGFSLPF
jgi:hypothetical protein